jgi:hypothetical protein
MSGRDVSNRRLSRRDMLLGSAAGPQLAQAQQPAASASPRPAQALAQSAAGQRPSNLLLIMSNDIGFWNVSVYSHVMMGYRTPNIDRIAREGAYFTNWYGQ